MSDLELLLEKVRAAESGSQEMDGMICISVQYGGRNSEGATNVRTDPDWEGDLLFEIGSEEGCNSIPPVTTSLDAIVALIEREFLVNTTRTTTDPSGCSAQITWWPEGLSGGKRVQSDEINVSLPLALCAALLSAKIQTGSGETGE